MMIFTRQNKKWRVASAWPQGAVGFHCEPQSFGQCPIRIATDFKAMFGDFRGFNIGDVRGF